MTSDAKVAFLRAHGADGQDHSSETLLEHLQGTARILADWDNPVHVCDAGLFHAVYGTESFTTQTIPESLRPTVRGLIGVEAERRAWLFGVLSQRQFAEDIKRSEAHRIKHRQTEEWVVISAEEKRDLVELVAANGLEQLPRMPPDIQHRSLGFFALVRDHVSDNAARSIDAMMAKVRAAAEQ